MGDAAAQPAGMANRPARSESTAAPEEVIRARRKRIGQQRLCGAFLVKLAAVALGLWLVFTFVFGIGLMEGESMYPRLRDGDVFLYCRVGAGPVIGDVATFTTSDGERHVGRVVAKGGDVVDMSVTGELLVNGHAQDEEIFYPTYKTDAITDLPCTLGESQVFLLSDLRTQGEDSRAYGAIDESKLDGKIIAVLRRRGI